MGKYTMKIKLIVILILLFFELVGNADNHFDAEFSFSNKGIECDSFIVYESNKNFALNEGGKVSLEHPYGTFVRMQTIRPSNYQHIVDALVQAKVKVVNIHIYTYALNLDNEAVLVSLLNKAGIDVLFRYIWIPKHNTFMNVSSGLLVSISQWEKYLLKALHEFDGKEGRPYVKYINFLDEPQLYYKQGGQRTFECKDLVTISKKGYDIVKKERPDMTVASTTICAYDDDFFNDLFTATLQDGTKYNDCIDILYFDYYAIRNVYLYPEVKKMYASIRSLQPEILKKPMWYCCGTTSYNRQPEERAETLVKFIITAFFAGADTFNVYSFVMGGGCSMKDGNTDYYGIIAPSVTNSYMSLLRVNDQDKAISYGDAFKKVYLGCPDTYPQTVFDYCFFYINENTVDALKKDGFIISGKGYTFTKVIINNGTSSNGEPDAKNVLYEGRHTIGPNGENAMIIPANKLSELQAHDRIIIYYDRSSADISNTWNKLETYKTFDSFVSLQKFLPEGSLRPQITDVGDLHISCWKNDKEEMVYCVFRDDFVRPQQFCFSYEGNPTIYDLYSNKMNLNLDNIVLGSAPIYIKGINKLKIKQAHIL